MKQKVAKFVSTAVILIAKGTSSTACNWLSYQPKVPPKLLKEKK